MTKLTGSGDTTKPNLLGGSFGVPGTSTSAGSALVAIFRGIVTAKDVMRRGGSVSSGRSGGTGGGGGGGGGGTSPPRYVER